MVNLFDKIFRKKKLPIIGTTEQIVDNNGNKLSETIKDNLIYCYAPEVNPMKALAYFIIQYGAEAMINRTVCPNNPATGSKSFYTIIGYGKDNSENAYMSILIATLSDSPTTMRQKVTNISGGANTIVDIDLDRANALILEYLYSTPKNNIKLI